MRKLGLDFGERSLGIALSDASNTLATGQANLNFTNTNFEKFFAGMQPYLKQYPIDEIVLGYPTHLDGNESKISKKVLDFKAFLERHVTQTVVLVDESYSTREALAILVQSDLSRRKQKTTKDRLAAQIILQRYLDQRKV